MEPMEIDDGASPAAAATAAVSAPNDGSNDQADEVEEYIEDLIEANAGYEYLSEEEGLFGLGLFEEDAISFVPDEILHRIETSGYDNPDCMMAEQAEEVDQPIYEEALLSLGMKRVLEGDDEAMEHIARATMTLDAAGTSAGTSSETAASLDQLPETLLQLIFHFQIREAHEALLLERVCKPLHWALRSDGDFWDQHSSGCELPFSNRDAPGPRIQPGRVTCTSLFASNDKRRGAFEAWVLIPEIPIRPQSPVERLADPFE